MTDKIKVPPRKTPGRDEFYLGMAYWMASKSKDPKTQCGSVIISTNNEPLGWGYNGPPQAIPDEEIDWDRPEKYPYIFHSEKNAISRSKQDLLKGATIYVTGKPCSPCALEIVNSGIKRVVYFPYKSDPGSMLSATSIVDATAHTDDIFQKGGVTVEIFQGDLSWMRDRMEFFKTIGIF